jgi:two-component system chemotaxis sensor kinase CheA
LPITLAMIRALMLRCADSTFAVPLANVEEVVAFDPKAVEVVEGRKILELHGESLPLCHLAAMFEMGGEAREQCGKVIVVSAASRRCGLVVDDIEGTRDIVIKPLTSMLRSWPGFAGASELGNKEIGLVIDVPGLLEEALGSVVSVRNKELEAF